MEAIVGGVRIYYKSVGPGQNLPLFVLHGGPGLDHTEMHPWLDPLKDMFRLIYVDLRGQGRSERVDPATLSLEVFADDITGLAEALDLPAYAVLGHSFGSFVALAHAIHSGTATHYVISGGTASFSKSAVEIQANLEAFEPEALRDDVTRSWAMEPHVKTQADVAELMRLQMPFHFASVETEAYRRYMAQAEQTVYAPEVLAYFAAHEYPIEYEDRLGTIHRPTLVLTGERDRTCTPRAARDLHAGIPGSELVILPDAGHMTFVEQPDLYFAALRDFFVRHPVGV